MSSTPASSPSKMRLACATRSLAAVRGGDELEVRHDAAYPDGAAEDRSDAVLDDEALAFGDVAQERLVLGEAEHEDAVADLDRAGSSR